MLIKPNSCLTRLKKLIKVWLSEGGSIQFDFLLKRRWISVNVVAKKVLSQHPCFKLAPVFIYFLFENFGGVGTKG